MKIELANSDEQIAACFPIMQQLRPHLRAEGFVERVRLQQSGGYHLACLEHEGEPVAVTGFRFVTNLAWGKTLYIDDLVSAGDVRSRGFGKALLDWVFQHAVENGCNEVHLDSGTQRKGAHRFYERECYEMNCLHFRKVIKPASW
jgi:GNAT superfamily N-acetyltransferase